MSPAGVKYQSPSNEDLAGLGTDPIPAKPYYCPAWFELEREAIFRRTWLNVGHVCELPGPDSFIVRQIDVLGVSLLITRDKQGKIRSFHNVCTHRGTELVSEADGRSSAFTCRYHAWTFGNDGELRGAPDFARFYVEASQCALRDVATEVCAGMIFVNLSANPRQGLRAFLDELGEELEVLPVARATCFSEWAFEVKANWKLVLDNFQENYHLRFIHPRSSAGGFGADNPFGYPWRFSFHGPHRKQYLWTNPDPVSNPTPAFAMRKLAELAKGQGLYESPHTRETFGLFPNLNIVGSPVAHFVLTVWPITLDRSRAVFRRYWVGDEANASERFAREVGMLNLMEVHSEDASVMEAGQRGLSSGAIPHIHLQSQEVRCRHAYVQVAQAVEAFKAECAGANT